MDGEKEEGLNIGTNVKIGSYFAIICVTNPAADVVFSTFFLSEISGSLLRTNFSTI